MALGITIKQGNTLVFNGKIDGIQTEYDLTALFDGQGYLVGVDDRITFYEDEDDDPTPLLITEVCWVDDDPETSFHGYVMDYMNNHGISTVFAIAGQGGHTVEKAFEAMSDYFHGFQECVNNLIGLYGLEFVFGDGFCYDTLFNLVVREIVRDYLGAHEIADI